VNYVVFSAMAVVTLAVGVPEEVVFGKQDGSGFNRDEGVPEGELVGKQDGFGCNRSYLQSEEDIFRKRDGAVRIRIRRWP